MSCLIEYLFNPLAHETSLEKNKIPDAALLITGSKITLSPQGII